VVEAAPGWLEPLFLHEQVGLRHDADGPVAGIDDREGRHAMLGEPAGDLFERRVRGHHDHGLRHDVLHLAPHG
jgi:hypothetical protein